MRMSLIAAAALVMYQAPSMLLASSTSGSKEFGSVACTITWQYNDTIGTKGDVKAELYLLPSPMHDPFSEQDVDAMWTASYTGTQPWTTKAGVYDVRGDGYEAVNIDHVAAGTYDALVISHNATSGFRPLDSTYIATLRPFFANDAALTAFATDKRSPVGGFKSALVPVVVRKGEVTHCSHDFGNAQL